MSLASRGSSIRADAEAWCAGRSWVWRAPLLAYLALVGVRHLRDPLYSSLFGGITLIGLTSDPVHDWNWLLSKLGILASSAGGPPASLGSFA